MEVGCFLALRQILYHLYTEMFADLQTRFNMTQMEIHVLLFLADNPQFDTAAELVNNRKLAKSQVSTAVESLAGRGYLLRRVEGRRIHLQLLPAADAVIREGRMRQKEFHDTVLAGVSQEEQKLLMELTQRILNNAREAEKRLPEERNGRGPERTEA